MNSRVVGLRVASAVFGLMGIVQLARALMGVGVSVGSHAVPLWPSAVAAVVLAALCVWLWRLSMEAPKSVDEPAKTA